MCHLAKRLHITVVTPAGVLTRADAGWALGKSRGQQNRPPPLWNSPTKQEAWEEVNK